MTILFTAIILISLQRNPLWWIHDYPKDIQEEYFKTHERVPSTFFSMTVLLKKGFATFLVIVLFIVLIKIAGARNFYWAFVVSYGLWSIINWYDCFILDWVFFANIKSIRLPGTEHMNRAYHQKKYHFIRAIYGWLIGLIPSLTASAIFAGLL